MLRIFILSLESRGGREANCVIVVILALSFLLHLRMNSREKHKALVLWAVLVLIVSTSVAENIIEVFEGQVKAEKETYLESKRKLYAQYGNAILRLAESFQKVGNLKGVLAAQEEAKLAMENQETGEVVVEGSERMRSILQSQLQELDSRHEESLWNLRTGYIRKFDHRMRELTKLGLLDEAKALNEAIAELKVQLSRMSPDERLKITGKIHAFVDDRATFFLNGEKVWATRWASTSETLEFSEGDSLVILLEDRGGSRDFIAALEITESKRIISFRASDFRILEDVGATRVTEEEFGSLNKRPDRLRGNMKSLALENSSDNMWGDESLSAIGTVLTRDLLESD
ncbi:MAG: hypothetical protein P1U85_02165 [Verrucomicrobiales bacterium]|nr:hypothetical protein [Verrucomicrobiales bacterium]